MTGVVGHVEVAVVGAGFAGLGMAMALRRSGIASFVLLERAASVGGTWRDNTYPGIACDVPSHLYGFTDHPNPHWSGVYATGNEIRCYLEQVADAEEIRPEFDTPVEAATWDNASRNWRLDLGGPHARTLHADVLILACGRLTEPAIPQLPGLESFPGPAVSHGQVGPRRGVGRGADRRRRHRRERGAGGARIGQAGPGHPVPAHPGVDRAAQRARLLRRRTARFRGRPGASAATCGLPSTRTGRSDLPPVRAIRGRRRPPGRSRKRISPPRWPTRPCGRH